MASGYNWLRRLHAVHARLGEWVWIWRLPTTEKCKVLFWLACHEASPTNLVRFRRSLCTSPVC